MVPLRSDYGESTTSTWGKARPQPRLTLHDYTTDTPAPAVATPVTRPAASVRRRSHRRGESLFCTLAVVTVLGFFLATCVGSLWHSVASSYASSFAPTAPVLTLRVGSGDTLWRYAARYGDPNSYILERVETIARDNHISSTTPLVPGQTVRVVVHNPIEIAKIQRQQQARVASASR